MRLDLHLHSHYSDGAWSPAELAVAAAQRRLKLWALTDHDCVDGCRELMQQDGFVPGVELTAWAAEREVHIVGLGIDPDAAELGALLAELRDARQRRIATLIERVAEHRGRRITLDDCRGPHTRVLTRSHLADALVRHGVAANRQAVFAELLGDAQLRDLAPPDYPTPARASAAIRAAGGVAILAHPGHYRDIHLIERLSEHCDGLESKHPHCPELLRAVLERLADEHGLLRSAGSDFHVPPCRMGDWRLSHAESAPIRRALGLLA